ncbi:MAG: 3-hydroxybutyryl-CoA dehydrogenase [Candidatus Wallbacteria bacterium]|nr:3-hydroxybutyryl-CoA dehydrogenase [Candidatus Wallbacteria bacterium]
MKRIMVVGAGTMGSGIAQMAAQAGYQVIMRDVDEKLTARGLEIIRGSLERFVKKGTLTDAQKAETLSNIKTTTALSAAKDCDLVVEAVTENLELKLTLFKELDQVCSNGVIFCSNTSSLPVTQMALATSRPEKFAGMHFFNPVPLMKLVEVVRGPLTSDSTVATVRDVALRMGKEPVDAKDTPGFIFNRLIVPYLNEAVWAVYEGVGSPSDIDKAMKLGGNMPIGPLALLDLIGLDVQLHVSEIFHREFGDQKFAPCPLLRQMVRAGQLGKKAGKGFFDYK